MSSFTAALALLLTWPAAPGRAEGLEDALGAARQALRDGRDEARARRDETLRRWISGPKGGLWDEEEGEPVRVLCGQRPCSQAQREEALDRLAAALARMPRFLDRGLLGQVVWIWREPGARRSGEVEGAVMTLRVPAGESFDDVLCHELAHVYHRALPAQADAYLALRARTPAMRRTRKKVLALLPPPSPPGVEPRPLPEQARRLLEEAMVPRRHDDDAHALRTDGEYWAVSVELVFLSGAEPGSLAGRLSEEELAFLTGLFKG